MQIEVLEVQDYRAYNTCLKMKNCGITTQLPFQNKSKSNILKKNKYKPLELQRNPFMTVI